MGGEHWITRSTSGMSNPRAATLVATSTSKAPFLKPFSVVSLCFWGMSPWRDWALWDQTNMYFLLSSCTMTQSCSIQHSNNTSIGVYSHLSASASTCLMEAFMESSLASFFVSQKTMVLPWLPLYTWMTSPSTAARWVQWHAMARC